LVPSVKAKVGRLDWKDSVRSIYKHSMHNLNIFYYKYARGISQTSSSQHEKSSPNIKSKSQASIKICPLPHKTHGFLMNFVYCNSCINCVRIQWHEHYSQVIYLSVCSSQPARFLTGRTRDRVAFFFDFGVKPRILKVTA